MKVKIIVGIIIPVFFIIFLTILASWPAGFSIEDNFDKEIAYKDVFSKSSNNALRIGEIIVTNDYFLPKRFDAPNYISCLYDIDQKRPLQSGGYVFYNEGQYSPNVEILDLSTKSADLAYYNPYSYTSKNYKTSVEIGSHQSKTLQIYYTPKYGSFQDNIKMEYETVLLIDRGLNNQVSCTTLNSEQMQNAIRISIIIPPTWCSDSDNSNSYNSFNNELSQSGQCLDHTGTTRSDYCQDSQTLVEYTCPQPSEEACKTQNVNCSLYGYNRCNNNRCSY